MTSHTCPNCRWKGELSLDNVNRQKLEVFEEMLIASRAFLSAIRLVDAAIAKAEKLENTK